MEDDIYDKISKYVEGKMSEKDKLDFELQITNDQEIAAKIQHYQNTVDAFEIIGLANEVEATLEEEGFFNENDAFNEPDKPGIDITASNEQSLSWKRMMSIAAAILMLIISACLFYASRTHSDPALASSFFETPELSRSLKDAGTEASQLDVGVAAYHAGKFEEAAEQFASFSADDDAYQQAQYNLAHTYYQQAKYSTAASVFQNLIGELSIEETEMREHAEWYLILTHLKMGETGQTFNTLMEKMLTNEDHLYHSFAKDLNKKLNSFWHSIVMK